MRISDWSSDVCSSDLIDAIEFFFINSVNTACVSDYAIADGLSVGQLVTDFADRFPHTSLRSDYRPPESSVVEIALYFVKIVTDADLLLAERSEEHTSELQSLMRISYAVFCLTKKQNKYNR